MLPGTSQKLCENDDISVLTKKEIIFHSFPTKWQDTFLQQKETIEDPNITLQMVKTYMQATKILSDNMHISKQHAREKPQHTEYTQNSRQGENPLEFLPIFYRGLLYPSCQKRDWDHNVWSASLRDPQ
ncbi:unnamed protein product [Cylindrotheca closterium]|uniref:Uncharacterized protein n=1 Tax=Cylindrotheca closterium TaxID=2856 RepID=A0AAD2JG77_9STRA|nr:unnamed protein product [Cylindrotheca closterium]